MIIVTESAAAAALKGWIAKTSLNALGSLMVLRMVLAFILHRGRMSCSQAAGSVASESIHRGELTRFLARPRWRKVDFSTVASGVVAEGKPSGQVSVSGGRHAGQSVGEEDSEHAQHRPPKTATGQGASLQPEEGRVEELSQLHVWVVDHAVGHPHPGSGAARFEGVLRREGADPSHHGRGGGRPDPRCHCRRMPK